MKIPAVLKNPDVVGWLIWLLLTLLLIAPCIYLISVVTYNATMPTLTLVITGVFAAAISAGVLSWIGNEAWYRLKQRKYAEKRKAMRKERRRKK